MTWRIVYRTDPDALVIGAVFAKKTLRMPDQVIETCRRRFRQYDETTEE